VWLCLCWLPSVLCGVGVVVCVCGFWVISGASIWLCLHYVSCFVVCVLAFCWAGYLLILYLFFIFVGSFVLGVIAVSSFRSYFVWLVLVVLGILLLVFLFYFVHPHYFCFAVFLRGCFVAFCGGCVLWFMGCFVYFRCGVALGFGR